MPFPSTLGIEPNHHLLKFAPSGRFVARIPAEIFVWTDESNLFGSEAHAEIGISDALLRPVEQDKMATALSESLTELENA